MTIDDIIRDEKLQYDIIREAAKISALLSGKINKYEYLTVEEILSSNQRQVIELPKFTYSRLDKVFKKQINTNEHQGKKIKAIKDDKKQRDNKKQQGNNELLVSKEREIFKNIYNKRLNKIDELSKKMIMVT